MEDRLFKLSDHASSLNVTESPYDTKPFHKIMIINPKSTLKPDSKWKFHPTQ
jgi:hypothetical protein